METNDLSKFDSSAKHPSLYDSINNFQNNQFGLNNFLQRINFNNEFYTTDENLLYKYKGFLGNFVKRLDCPKEFWYHPEWVSKIIYGTVDLWFLVMWFNPIASVDEFCLNKIYVFDPSRMELINHILNSNKREYTILNKNPPLIEKHILTPVKIRDRKFI